MNAIAGLIAPKIVEGTGIITMSLLPIAIVVISFFLLFRALGRKSDENPGPFQDNQGFDSGRRSTGRNKPNPTGTPRTPPRHRPCRVCGVPATKRCLRCKSAYYCSDVHSTLASLPYLPRFYASNAAARKPIGLADTQTSLFTRPDTQPLTLEDAHSSRHRRTCARSSSR